jgi:hypothetical protein
MMKVVELSRAIVSQLLVTMLGCTWNRFVIVSLPSVTDVFYSRDAGYRLRHIDLDTALKTTPLQQNLRPESTGLQTKDCHL